jgi:homocysteine S-methyltransferase
VYTVEPLRRLEDAYHRATGEPLSVPLVAGVLPIASARHAEFLHNEVPGIEIPTTVRDHLARAGDAAWRTGLAIAVDLVAELRDAGVAGIYVMPQFGRYDRAAELVEAAKGVIATARRRS